MGLFFSGGLPSHWRYIFSAETKPEICDRWIRKIEYLGPALGINYIQCTVVFCVDDLVVMLAERD